MADPPTTTALDAAAKYLHDNGQCGSYRDEWTPDRCDCREEAVGVVRAYLDNLDPREVAVAVADDRSGVGVTAVLRAIRPPVKVAELAGAFEGGPDSVEWLREQKGRP